MTAVVAEKACMNFQTLDLSHQGQLLEGLQAVKVVIYVETVGTEEGTWMRGMKGRHAEESAVEYTPRRRQSD